MDSMALFDLKTEKWTSFLQGPITSYPELNSIDDILPEPQEMEVYQNLSMAELNNVLVVAQHTDYRDPKIDSFVDLWYLVDSDKDTWDRKHRIGLGKTAQDAEHYFPWVNPSLVLDDGRIVIYIHVARSNVQGQYTRRLVRLYDPETETLSSDLVDVRNIHSLGFFTGSLLGLSSCQVVRISQGFLYRKLVGCVDCRGVNYLLAELLESQRESTESGDFLVSVVLLYFKCMKLDCVDCSDTVPNDSSVHAEGSN
uniref:F-box associated domain-containing protein n=1 Tax=Oryza brachyantha TaxID=4533 RepID=J3MJ84_ORYBR